MNMNTIIAKYNFKKNKEFSTWNHTGLKTHASFLLNIDITKIFTLVVKLVRNMKKFVVLGGGRVNCPVPTVWALSARSKISFYRAHVRTGFLL